MSPQETGNSPSADPANLSGTTLDRYNLETLLGTGAMGRVYRAVHTVTLRPCALKLLPDELLKHPDFISRFRAEARMLAKLNHPNIVQIYSGGEAQSRFFLEMEYIDGGDLQKRVAEASATGKKGLPEDEVRTITRSVLSALTYAHQHGIIHRDLKPANILLSKTGEVKVSDFGLAAVVGEEHHRNMVQATVTSFTLAKVTSMETIPGRSPSESGSFAGTILYMSPQAMRAEPPDPRDDLFSLGIVVYYMLTGRTPAINYTPVSRQRPGLKYNWDPFIATCLEEERGDRFANASAGEKALGRLGRRGGKWRFLATTTALVALAALGGAVVLYNPTPTSQPPIENAKQALTQQTIRFEPLAAQISTMVPVPLVATASSGLSVQFTVTKGSATVTGSTLTAIEAGEVTIRALQRGDAHHAPAPPVEYTVRAMAQPVATAPPPATDQRKAQTITIDGMPENIFSHTTFELNVGSNSGLPVSLWVAAGPATLSGNQLNIIGAGQVVLRAEQAGDTAFLPASPVEKTLLVEGSVARDPAGQGRQIDQSGSAVPSDGGGAGMSPGRNYQQARQLYEKAATDGNVEAMYKLGALYDNGQGGPEDNRNARQWYEKAAGAGNAEALASLGDLYYNGSGVAKDNFQARRWYEKAAAAGHAQAMAQLGQLYRQGFGGTQDYIQARQWFEKAAAKGNNYAMRMLGGIYEYGEGVVKDRQEALGWYEKAAAVGYGIDMYFLGTRYDGSRSPGFEDYPRALQWYKKAAAAGNTDGMRALGDIYDRGQPGVPQDHVQARSWYEKAAAAGDNASRRSLGVYYNEGRGVPRNYQEALKWFEKAAVRGDHAAMSSIGDLYANGRGVPRDITEGIRWYERAAGAGNADAMFKLGALYDNGLNVPHDDVQARRWYEKAAAVGNARAMSRLGVLYYSGKGVTQDYGQARQWFEKGANAGSAQAMSNLGVIYENGTGVTQDYAQARQWYEKGADVGSVEAMNNLGAIYKNGTGVSQDYVQARQWYEKAATAGNAEAMSNLGLFYEKGRGVSQNWALALQWYNKAIAAGSASTMRRMGALYNFGQGVARDFDQALQWYEKAAAAGSAEAMYDLGLLYSGGQGVSSNSEKSREYYEKAAAAGSSKAMSVLGTIYEEGDGVAQDNQQARRWYEKAAAAGSAYAKNRLRSMEK